MAADAPAGAVERVRGTSPSEGVYHEVQEVRAALLRRPTFASLVLFISFAFFFFFYDCSALAGREITTIRHSWQLLAQSPRAQYGRHQWLGYVALLCARPLLLITPTAGSTRYCNACKHILRHHHAPFLHYPRHHPCLHSVRGCGCVRSIVVYHQCGRNLARHILLPRSWYRNRNSATLSPSARVRWRYGRRQPVQHLHPDLDARRHRL